MSEAAAPAATPAGQSQAPSAPAPTATPQILTGDQSPAPQQTSWLDGLPDDLKGNPSLAKFKDINGLAKSYSEMEKMMGKPRLEAPSENWKPEQWSDLYNKLGRPSTPDEYKFNLEGIPQDRIDTEMQKYFAEKMHGSGLTQKQAESLHKEFVSYQMNREQAQQKVIEARNEQAFNQLKQEWGDKFDANADSAFRAAREFGGQELSQLLQESGLGNHPTLVKMFAKIGGMMAEDTVRGRGSNSTFNQSPATALAEITAMKMDKDMMAAFNNRSHPGHKEVVDKWNKLHNMAYSAQSPL